MFTVKGQVLKVFQAPAGKTKAGEAYGGDNRIQLLGNVILKNGETKNELITLTMPTRWGLSLLKATGREISLPVALMASGNVVKAFIPDAAEIPQDVLKEIEGHKK